MLLQRLRLENIRSYTDQEIEFPQGSVLLSGDIGTGKTTILLAIEFAIFGLIRGISEGTTLLRNGETKGQVILECNINNQPLTIQRTLHRNKNGIAQHNCTIIHQGTTQECTPKQATAQILELLGYPQDHSAKSLIYRYTVFTSQEQMKSILFDEAKRRLDTLRTLFDIDKYKTIVNNTQHVSRELKRDAAFLQGSVASEQQIKDLLVQTQLQVKEIEKQRTECQQEYETENKKKQAILEKLANQEVLLEQYNNQKQLLDQASISIKEKKEQSLQIQQENIKIQEQMGKIGEQQEPKEQVTQVMLDQVQKKYEAKSQEVFDNKQLLQNTNNAIEKNEELIATYQKYSSENIDEELRLLRQKNETITKKIEESKDVDIQCSEGEAKVHNLHKSLAIIEDNIQSQENKDTINQGTCPTCKQEVTADHVHSIETIRKEKLHELSKKKQALRKSLQTAQLQYNKIKEKKEEITKLEKEQMLLQQNLEQLQKKEQEQKEIAIKIQNTQALLSQLDQKKTELTQAEMVLKNSLQNTTIKLQETKEKARIYQEFALVKVKRDQLVSQLKVNEEKQQLLNDSIESLTEKEKVMLHEVQKLAPVQDVVKEIKIQEQSQSKKIHDIQLEIAKLNQNIQNTLQQQQQAKNQLEQHKKTRQDIKILQDTNQWIQQLFTPLMQTIEQHIFHTVYHEFNSLFVTWFNTLVEDDTLQAQLDQQFTPIIQQNGYDIDLQNLSGGEKTCVALAYRLALNKVVNDIVQDINTKDILILDEPTDGFSHEQLDRVREVLNQLSLKQLIVVSHEPKMESFMEHTLRIQKDQHQSIIST